MNFALPAMAILVLILPGILFNYYYRRGLAWKSQVFMRTLAEEAAWGVFFAMIIHLMGIFILDFTPNPVNLKALLALLSGSIKGVGDGAQMATNPPTESRVSMSDLLSIVGNVKLILGYLILSNIAGIAFGLGLHWLVRRCKLDLKYQFIRFESHWHYFFHGDIRAFNVISRNKGTGKNKANTTELIGQVLTRIAFTNVRVIVEEPGRLVEYFGRLVSYDFNSQKDLEFIVLEEAHYCILGKNDNEDSLNPTTPVKTNISGETVNLSNPEISREVDIPQIASATGAVNESPYESKNKIKTISHFISLRYSNIRSMGVYFEPDDIYVETSLKQQINSFQSLDNTLNVNGQHQSGKAEGTAASATSDSIESRYRLKKGFDEIDFRDFCERSYKVIRDYIESSIDEIKDVEGIKARFSDITAHSFTCVAINKSYKHCAGRMTVHIGERMRDTADIYYSFSENTAFDAVSTGFRIEADDYELYLKNFPTASNDNERITPRQAAETIWEELLKLVGISYA